MLCQFQAEILISCLFQINHQVRRATTARPPNDKTKSCGQAWRVRCYLRERETETESHGERDKSRRKEPQKLSEEATMDVAALALATPDDVMRISLALLSLFKIYNPQYHEQS